MKSLSQISKKYDTDKKDHGYIELYEKHLPKKVNKFMEIGVWKGESIKMFKDYYKGEGMFYALDTFTEGFGLITPEELQAIGINHFRGSQADPYMIEGIKEQFTVIVEDGSHLSDHQLISFKHFFINNIESGGLYVVEDLHCCRDAYWHRGVVIGFENTILGAFEKYKREGTLESQFISKEENEQLLSMINEISVYKPSGELAFISKK